MRGTHQLEGPDRETGQDMERMQTIDGHSLPGEPRQRDMSGHRKNVRGHPLPGESRWETSQDTERM